MTLDFFLLFAFLFAIFVACITNMTQIKSINVFTIGKMLFSTFVLSSTITATWLSRSGFFITLTKFYNNPHIF